MPRLIDYAARFQFLREAAFAIVHDYNVGALSRRSVGAVLGTAPQTVRRILSPTADLRCLAAEHALDRRRATWLLDTRPEGDLDRALDVMSRVVPTCVGRIPEERVWLRLALDSPDLPTVPEPIRPVPSLSDNYAIALQGYVAEDADIDDRPKIRSATHDGNAFRRLLEEEAEHTEKQLAMVLRLIGAADDERARVWLAVLIDGLRASVVLGHVTPDEAKDLVRSELCRWAQPDGTAA